MIADQMTPIRKRYFMLMALLTFLLTAGSVLKAQTIQISKENKTIAISTSGEASVLADTAQVSIGFSTYGTDSENTYAEGSHVSNAVLSAIRELSIKESQIASHGQNLQPLGDDDKLRFSRGQRFHLTQTWWITVPASAAATLLNTAISAGANNSGDIQWSLQRREDLEAEATKKALGHAREIAERMAKGLNAKVGPLVYASNQQPVRAFYGAALNTESASIATTVVKVAPLAIVPDKVPEFATVYAVFALE